MKNKMAQSSSKKSPSIPPLSDIKKHLLMYLRDRDKLEPVANINIFPGDPIGYKNSVKRFRLLDHMRRIVLYL